MASCKWCGTWKKNNLFKMMQSNGSAEAIHKEYVKFVKHFKPDYLYLSGGEPLLLKDIGRYVAELSKHVGKEIFLFTSYQYPEDVREKIALKDMPFEKTVLTHTTAGFNKEIWKDMTNYSFDQYIGNIRNLSKLPWGKRVKFIINNGDPKEEIDLFNKLIEPDDSFRFNLKLINEQSGSNALSKIKKTSDKTTQYMHKDIGKLFPDVDQEVTGLDIIDSFKKGSDFRCKFKESLKEIRFAFYTSNQNGIKFKYRFCPFFPLEKHYKYKVGRDSVEDVMKSFNDGMWHRWCETCRLKHYT